MTKILKIQSVGGLLVNCFDLIKTHTVAVVSKCFFFNFTRIFQYSLAVT